MSIMFPQTPTSVYQIPKCFVTYGAMGHVDPLQPPSKGKPWATIMSKDFIHKVELIMPVKGNESLQRKLVAERSSPEYFKVTMTLSDILEGAFFTEYIKRGNILMRSEGDSTAGSMFTLQEGTLTMFLDKETYERAGLVGKPHGTKGGRGLRPRWIISYDLRSPEMLHGKKGFDRLVYAAKKVLNQPMRWLLCNVTEFTPTPDPLLKHFATKHTSSPGVLHDINFIQAPLTIPSEVLANGDRAALEEVATDYYEWLSLIRLGSPRVELGDQTDPYLSRYCVPEGSGGEVTICKLVWQGFLSPSWLRALLVDILGSCGSGSWFSISASCFSKRIMGQGNELVFLRPPAAAGRYLMWEMKYLD